MIGRTFKSERSRLIFPVVQPTNFEFVLNLKHRVVGRSSAFGELRLWDERHPLAKARNSA
ncbi:MAG: hypothetical protein ACXWID_19670 [Pyrinomonadaceae bacterium]